jgi:aspartyl-tRNA(Asn)/glutamyl-tRNA(Gln) amidotransferase subunit C
VSVSLDEVRRIAALARLGLESDRADALAAELNTILAHMEVLSRVDTDDVPEVVATPTSGQPLRPDHGPPIPLAARPEAFAPTTGNGFFLVPRLSTHEDREAP